ncbi:MAG: flagellar biosynthesis anti-sigma factor FlgM [Bdellovibrionales bacterium GWA2_49_15]|nr:MAG: flagellar biosynthesis anti-sigma factor FlgM [Bdellovibrionales bacterium GWA2_49_15]
MAGPVENNTKAPFFPEKKIGNLRSKNPVAPRNEAARQASIEKTTSKDAKVDISDGIKDFARIKKAAVGAPPPDNSAKIASLKQSIKNGTYEVDYDGLAEKMMASEF